MLAASEETALTWGAAIASAVLATSASSWFRNKLSVDASDVNFVEVELTAVGSKGALYGWLRILWQDVTLGRARTIIHRGQGRQLEQTLVRVPFRRNSEECRRVNLTTRTFRSLALRS